MHLKAFRKAGILSADAPLKGQAPNPAVEANAFVETDKQIIKSHPRCGNNSSHQD
jgi:hypothetical protein